MLGRVQVAVVSSATFTPNRFTKKCALLNELAQIWLILKPDHAFAAKFQELLLELRPESFRLWIVWFAAKIIIIGRVKVHRGPPSQAIRHEAVAEWLVARDNSCYP